MLTNNRQFSFNFADDHSISLHLEKKNLDSKKILQVFNFADVRKLFKNADVCKVFKNADTRKPFNFAEVRKLFNFPKMYKRKITSEVKMKNMVIKQYK